MNICRVSVCWCRNFVARKRSIDCRIFGSSLRSHQAKVLGVLSSLEEACIRNCIHSSVRGEPIRESWGRCKRNLQRALVEFIYQFHLIQGPRHTTTIHMVGSGFSSVPSTCCTKHRKTAKANDVVASIAWPRTALGLHHPHCFGA